VLYGVFVGDEEIFVHEPMCDEEKVVTCTPGGEEKGGCARDPL